MSRVATVILVIASALVSVLLADIRSGWQAVLEIGAGTGAVYLLRWYWWRISAWSEISAMVAALATSILLHGWAPFVDSGPIAFAKNTLTITSVTTLLWIIVTLITPPESQEVLVRFYRQMRPQVTGWKPIAALAPEVPLTCDLSRNLLAWFIGCIMVYAMLFAIGQLCLGRFS